jgi:IMP dehydrogenase
MTKKDMKLALTFDDVLLVPSESNVLPRDVDVSSRLTDDIILHTPILSAAMDTVTESAMAIAMAREGGLGVLHKNMSIERQCREVERVKRSESGVIIDPVTIAPDKSVRDAVSIMRHRGISGLPVITVENQLVGILTERDIRFEENLDQPVSAIMTSKKLVTAPKGTTLEDARKILQKKRIEKLLIVEEDGTLCGLVTVKDLLMKQRFPFATLDIHGRLRVAAAIGATDDVLDRVAGLVDAGIDLFVLDSAHGHSEGVLDAVKQVKKGYSSIPLVAGNVATAKGTKDLIDRGADVVKIGIGAGASCTTRIIAGIGVPQLTAIMDSIDVAKKSGVTVISDGGVRYSGDIAKAIAAGAGSVMLGSLLAGLDESPGETILREGRQYKSFRGMGSMGTMAEGSADRYFQEGEKSIKLVPEGVEGMVPYRGSVRSNLYQLIGGLRASMGYCGAHTIDEMQSKTEFIRITPSASVESHPHDVQILKESPNYQVMNRIKD